MRLPLTVLPLAVAAAAVVDAVPAQADTASVLTELRLDLTRGSTEVTAFTADGNSSSIPLAGLPARSSILGLTASRGGDRLVSLDRDARVNGADAESRVVVRDISGAVVGVPDRVTTKEIDIRTQDPSTVLTGSPALSPDGNTAAWLRQNYVGCTMNGAELRLSSATGTGLQVLRNETGTPLSRRGISEVTFLDQDTLVIGVGQRDYSIDECRVPPIADTFQTVSRTGEVAAVTGLDSSVDANVDRKATYDSLAFSPDGTRVAFVRSVSGGYGSAPSGLFTAPVTRTGNSLAVGTPVSLGEGTSPSFSRDGSTVLFERDDVPMTAPAAGGQATPLRARAANRLTSLTANAVRESDAPAAPASIGTPIRSGSTATVPFTVATDDPTASRVRVTRTTPGLPTSTFEAALPVTTVSFPVVNGRTYTLAVQVIDRSGNVGPAVTSTLPATVPAAAVRVSGQQLNAGQELRAANGVRFRVGADGNLVSYAPSGRVLWQSRTRTTGAVLRVQGDGNLVLRDSAGRVRFQTGTAGRGSSVLTVQGDGNVVLYTDGTGAPSWSTRTGRLTA